MDETAKNKLKAMLEAVIFTSAEPLELSALKGLTDEADRDLEAAMDELAADYAARDGGMLIVKIAGGYQMIANPNNSEILRKLRGAPKSQKLSVASLETLAIVAYKQPITKIEVEEIRGVNSDGVLKTLLEKRFIKIIGKKEAPGKPMLYSTTKEFLQYFGLNDLTELPTLKDLEREEAA